MQLYNENNEEVGIKDVCIWWIKNYPEDIFKTFPEEVVAIRENAKKILQKSNDYLEI